MESQARREVLNSGLFTSDKNEWETPRRFFADLDREFTFTLDACASRQNAKCETYFTKEMNGLSKPWSGIVWMNPPYGREIKTWVEKAFNEGMKKALVVALLPVRSDTKWWHQFVMKASEIRLCDKRLKFEHSDNMAPFPAAIVIFGKSTKRPVLTTQKVRLK